MRVFDVPTSSSPLYRMYSLPEVKVTKNALLSLVQRSNIYIYIYIYISPFFPFFQLLTLNMMVHSDNFYVVESGRFDIFVHKAEAEPPGIRVADRGVALSRIERNPHLQCFMRKVAHHF